MSCFICVCFPKFDGKYFRMNSSLRFISISHKKASVAQRDKYYISEEEKSSLTELLCKTFPDITGLFLLSTCNRTEIYFESVTTLADELRDFFIFNKTTASNHESKNLFDCSNHTEDSAKHLLKVSSGLLSSVLGDAEIIHQIKKAYQFSISNQLMSTLLERVMQTVFKNHKRISNETHFRDGTTSIAYKSLKVICNTYGKALAKKKKILFIGAGDIVKQLFKYNSKFNFNDIYISNRTEEKAIRLAKTYKCGLYDWKKILDNNFEGFDVIISAASNCHHLIKNISIQPRQVIAIDLAIPCNIDKSLAFNENIIFYDLDSFDEELEDTKEKRNDAIVIVDEIIDEELSLFIEWLQEAPLRALLRKYKITVYKKIKDCFKEDYEEIDLQVNTNRIMRKLVKQAETTLSEDKIDAIIIEEVSLLKEANI